MKLELFNHNFQLTQSAHQAHLVFRVYVPANLSEIEVQFKYGPIVEANPEVVRKAVVREGLNESLVQEDTTVRNLLTVSINDPETIRGAHHFFSEDQLITINQEKATEGFLAGKIQEGFWEFIISGHGIFSNLVTGQLVVNGISENIPTKTEETVPFRNLQFVGEKKNRTRQTPEEPIYMKRLELHSHTVHSDAPQTTESLLAQAEDEKIDWLAITDHNTITALYEAEENDNYNRQVRLLNGIEYTTFYGHFLVHGPRDEILLDWTKLSKSNIEEKLEKLKEKDVMITIAHPFDGGNPFCTGCRWEYHLDHLKFVDAIEVWNSTNPHQSLSNEDVFHQWTRLLEQGHEVAAVSGRDWHQFYPGEAIAYTYVLVPVSETESDILQALKLGRTYSSIRPEIDFKVNEIHILGDRVEDKTDELELTIQLAQLEGGDTVQIYSQHALIYEKVFTGEHRWQEIIRLQNDGYSLLRVEVKNEANERVAFTNPIYIHRQ